MPTNTHDITIASGFTLAGPYPLRVTETIVGVIFPSGFTTAPVGFLTSPLPKITDPSQLSTFMYNGAEYLVSGVSMTQLALDPSLFVGVRSIAVRSGSQGSPVAQATTRVLTLITQEF